MQMNTVYPTEEKPNFPPSYEQAINDPQGLPPASSPYNVHSPSPIILQPQSVPVGMYSTSPMISYPQAPPFGLYPSSGMIPPSGGMYPTSAPGHVFQQSHVGNHMLITTQSLLYGDLPIQCICPHCQQTIVTRVEKQTGLVSWLICGGILLLGGWLGCCLIPFCVDSLKDTEHYCPSCAVLLGTRRRM